MKFLIVDTYYEPFLNSIYRQNPGAAESDYNRQQKLLVDACFGTSDFYSAALESGGMEARDIIANCAPLQERWAAEFAPDVLQQAPGPGRLFEILKRQVQLYKPDVLFVHDVNWASEALLEECRELVPLIVGQNASPIRSNLRLSAYDLLLSSIPAYVSNFRSRGVASEYFCLGFGRRILDRLPEKLPRRLSAAFVGGYSNHHRGGTRLLEAIAGRIPVDFWGYGGQALPETSPIRQRYHGEAWALDMYRVLAQAKIALNRHIDIAGDCANNMRLYEATGVGACLVTDAKRNLHTLFEPDREVVTYRSAEECIEKVAYLLEHEDERVAIAKAGQARTLRDHTYAVRMQELTGIIERHWQPRSGSSSAPHPPARDDMQSNFDRSQNRPKGKKTLIYSSANSAAIELAAVSLNLTRQFAQIGHAVEYIAAEANAALASGLRDLGVTLVALPSDLHGSAADLRAQSAIAREFLQARTAGSDSVSLLFVDESPAANLAAKQAAILLGVPYSVFVGSAAIAAGTANLPNSSLLAAVRESLRRAKSVSTASEPVLQDLRSKFGLDADRGKVLAGSPLPAAPPPSVAPNRPEPPIPNKPHWEYLPQGWATQDETILGWNVQSILDTQMKKWPEFARALQGTTPVGMSHESENVSGADYGTHNTMMSFGYVLALAAQGKQKISILDWGSGIGHYYLIARALLPGVDIEYYGKDLPILCEGGRQVLPGVTFFDRDADCFQRQYDLIVASSSVQYSQNWQEIMANLAKVARGYLYVTRLPIVHRTPSFVVVQRPYAYGYHTEYMGWFFNRQEFIGYVAQQGMSFLREFLIAEKYPVPNAPEMGEARGFLFRA